MGIRFDITGADEIGKSIEAAAKQFPYSAEKVLKKEARNISKDLKSRVDSEAKGHHYNGKNLSDDEEKEIKKNQLAKSFQTGKVIHSGSKHTIAVTSKAPHYHLYEEGHDLVTHNRKNKRGKGKIGTGKKIGHVSGRKTVARYMAQRSEQSELIGQELLDEILKDAGLE